MVLVQGKEHVDAVRDRWGTVTFEKKFRNARTTVVGIRQRLGENEGMIDALGAAEAERGERVVQDGFLKAE
jgi:hypothetical protein